jgi:hypothetical protein
VLHGVPMCAAPEQGAGLALHVHGECRASQRLARRFARDRMLAIGTRACGSATRCHNLGVPSQTVVGDRSRPLGGDPSTDCAQTAIARGHLGETDAEMWANDRRGVSEPRIECPAPGPGREVEVGMDDTDLRCRAVGKWNRVGT